MKRINALALLLALLLVSSAARALVTVTSSSHTDTTITITWTTDSTEQNDFLLYDAKSGDTCTLTSRQSSTSSCSTSHTATLTGLTGNTTYCVRPGGSFCPYANPVDNTGPVLEITTGLSTSTPTITLTATPTKTITLTPTPTPTSTNTTVYTPTFTPTATLTFSASPTFTLTRTATLTATPTPSQTKTATPTPSQTKTATPTFTATPTATPALSGGFGWSEYVWDRAVNGGTVTVHGVTLVGGSSASAGGELPSGCYVYAEDIFVTETKLTDAAGTAKLAIGNTYQPNCFSGSAMTCREWNVISPDGQVEGLAGESINIPDSTAATIKVKITGEAILTGKIRIILKWYKPLY